MKTSDGSLCVGQNVILIDSLLKVLFKNIYLSIFKDDNYKFSMVAVGGYGRGELAPFSDLDLLFLIPDFLNKTDTQKIYSKRFVKFRLNFSTKNSCQITNCFRCQEIPFHKPFNVFMS